MSELSRHGGFAPPVLGHNTREPSSLVDVLDRVLDKGVVIAGDIRINLLDIELLTIKVRLLIASAGLSARHVAEGISFELTGPWPAYSFVHLDLSMPQEARP